MPPIHTGNGRNRASGNLAAFACLLWLSLPCAASAEPTPIATIKPGTPAPSVQFKDESGQMQALDAKGATLTVVHLWATWCIPCIAELPRVDEAAKAYEKRGVRMLAIALDGNDTAKVTTFYNKHGITALKPYLDPKMQVFRAFGVNGLPSTIFIDKNGNQIARADGSLAWDAMTLEGFLP